MTEKKKYAEIYGRDRQITAEDRAAIRQIWHEIWGDELAYELAPTNFITWHELHRVAAELRIRAGSRFVDLGCGGGGPGLWVAEKTGAGVVGIDFSPEACSAARSRAAAKHADVTAEYRIADMTSTGLPAASADAAMSIDAMQIVPSRISAFHEAARLLRPSARFVLTTWDHPGVMPPGALLPGREIVPDSRPLLEKAGFRVLTYDRIASWDQRAATTYRELLEHRETVSAVGGEAMVREAEWGALHAHRSIHVFVVCELRDEQPRT
jgi:cyclopropane fatty-acyl-phospholipid synthase-like methyltransferase